MTIHKKDGAIFDDNQLKVLSLIEPFATGADLDHIGATYYQEARLTITAADPLAVFGQYEAANKGNNRCCCCW